MFNSQVKIFTTKIPLVNHITYIKISANSVRKNVSYLTDILNPI